MSEPTPLLELKNILRHFTGGDTVVKALDDVSLSIWQGEFVAIMGQSGSGKSTLMNILGCLDRPTGGSYRIRGIDVSSLDSDQLAALRRDTFGFIFQRYNLLATISAEENVEIPAIYSGQEKDARITRARELLTRLGLGDRGGHRPSELSGGQQQRVAVARALMNDPAVILADEPTGALDSKSGVEVMALLKQLHSEGRTIILITHDEHVARHADRVIRVQDGKIVSEEGTVHRGQSQSLQNPPTSHSAGFSDMLEAAKMALRSLHTNLFRTALTLLGIIIGVASVIIMLAVGEGGKQKVLDQISAMGTNLLSVRPGAPGMRGGGGIMTLSIDDANAISKIPNITMIVPERIGQETVRYGNVDQSTSVQGVGHLHPIARDWAIAQGSFFTERDVQGYAPVALLGQTVYQHLFPGGQNPVGEYVIVKNVPFEIIGVMSPKGAGFGGDRDDAIFMPYTTAMVRLLGRSYLSSVVVKVEDVNKITETQDAITKMVLERHRGVNDFSIRNFAEFINTAVETQNTLTILLGAVAAISLLVGGIGVMNIMLVSVTERTREIGIRMATGARMHDIMLQFNTEAAVVCTVGGILGVILGLGGSGILHLFEISVIITPLPAILAFSCAVLTGLIFGYLPARKAARLDPVVALASE